MQRRAMIMMTLFAAAFAAVRARTSGTGSSKAGIERQKALITSQLAPLELLEQVYA